MSHTIPIERASNELRGLVRSMQPGDEIVLNDNEKPVARIVSEQSHELASAERKSELELTPGRGARQGKLRILDDGDDVILDHFKDYLP
jgi:antitoxin (DNA-binding transcriptional repressor) of toxin-antitoxin stability system